MSNASEHLSRLGVEAPSGDLMRDLRDGKRVLLRRGQPCTRVADVGERVLKFICSTDGIKRDGNRVRNDRSSWDFRNFEKNPVMLWTHDYGSSERPPMPPIGSWVDWGVEPDGNGGSALVMSGRFATHEFADLVYNLYLEGHMRAVSIGWTPLEYEEILDGGKFVGWDFTRNELLECSAVPIPADPDAIMVAAQRGMIPERALAHFGNWLTPSRGVAYILDSRDRPVVEATRTDSVTVDFAKFWAEVAQAAEASERGGSARAEGDTSVTCPACGAMCPENANYCPMCGASLKVDEQAAATDIPAGEEPDPSEARAPRAEDEILDAVAHARGCGDKMWDEVTRMCDMAERCMGTTRAEGVDGEEAPAAGTDPADDPLVAAATAAESVMALASEIVSATQAIYEALVGDAKEDSTEGEGSMAEQAAGLKAKALRIGKKISGGRMSALEEAHDTIRSGVKYLREILDAAKGDMAASAPDEAAELRARVAALIERKEEIVLRKRVESLVERKERLRQYASSLLPGRKAE